MVLDLREDGRVMPRSELILNECPECGSRWSSACPFCGKTLEVTWRSKFAHCLNCGKKVQPKA
jgi:DNA-directed RNA polymerase subunit RPC12/RpoP